jgi:ASC-1-like (ASCH) protein
MFDLSVQQIYYDAIANGTKTIEGRLAKEKYRALKPGDEIRFSNNEGTQSLVKKVGAVHVYPTFADSFKVQNFKHAIPDAASVADAIRVYEQFYTKEMQQKHGVVFIALQ